MAALYTGPNGQALAIEEILKCDGGTVNVYTGSVKCAARFYNDMQSRDGMEHQSPYMTSRGTTVRMRPHDELAIRGNFADMMVFCDIDDMSNGVWGGVVCPVLNAFPEKCLAVGRLGGARREFVERHALPELEDIPIEELRIE